MRKRTDLHTSGSVHVEVGAKRFSSPLLLRYVLTYLIIFLFPSTLLGTLWFIDALDSLRAGVNAEYERKINAVSAEIDRIMADFRRGAVSISANRKLQPHNMRRHVPSELEGIEELWRYQDASIVQGQFLLYYKGDDALFTPEGKYVPDIYLSHVVELHDWPEFRTDISQIAEAQMRIGVRATLFRVAPVDLLILIQPVSSSGTLNKDMVLVNLIDRISLFSRLDLVAGGLPGYLTIADYRHDTVATLTDAPERVAGEVEAHMSPASSRVLTTSGKTQYVTHSVRGLSGLVSYLTVPTPEYLGRIDRARIYIAFVLLGAAGLALVLFFSMRSYRPIRSLVRTVFAHRPETAGQRTHDEIRDLESAFQSVIAEADVYRSRLQEERHLVTQQILSSCLVGSLDARGRSLAVDLGIDLEGRFHTVLLVDVLTTGASLAKDRIIEAVQHTRKATEDLCSVEFVSSTFVPVILSQTQPDADAVSRVAAHLQRACAARKLTTAIFVGSIVCGEQGICDSFMDALARQERERFAAVPSIVSAGRGENQANERGWCPDIGLERYSLSLQLGVRKAAVEEARAVIERIRNGGHDSDTQRFLCATAAEIAINVARDLGGSDLQQLSVRLLRFDTLLSFEARFTALTIAICGILERSRNSADETLRREMLEYVNTHILDYSLSLERLAERFEVSVYYMSRFFQKQTGINFTVYVGRHRMEKALELIQTTDLPVKEIATAVGYANASYFIRKFKSIVGTTPSALRVGANARVVFRVRVPMATRPGLRR